MSAEATSTLLRRTAEGLATLRRSRSADEWQREAFQAVRGQFDGTPDPEALEVAMTTHLHELAERAGQARQLREAAREFRAKSALPRDVIRRNEEQARNG